VNTIVLGLGNPFWGDDSAGIRVVRTLHDRLPHLEVTMAEASIAGIDILDLLAGYDKAIIVDAIETKDGTPGTIYRLEMKDVVANYNVCPHEMNFIASIELGRKIGLLLPTSITIFAIEVVQTALPLEECTLPVRASIPLCTDMIECELQTNPG
jgi:hydrogenase maturation protease